MRSYDEMEHHPTSEKLVNILCGSDQDNEKLFFRVLVAYYFGVVASTMRCKIKTHERGMIPVNTYAINLAPSGFGKTKGCNKMEDQVIDQFQSRFVEETFPLLAEQNIAKQSHQKAVRNSTDPDEELAKMEKTFERLGPLAFSFDSGSAPAAKQLRQKLLMAKAGALNLQIDEIGSNLMANVELLTTYLELYDVGRIKQKLVKNTNDNFRYEDLRGETPANLLAFGTPAKLLDGGKVEEEFNSMLDTGYARRCLFGYVKGSSRALELTVDEFYQRITAEDASDFLEDCSDRFAALADQINLNKELVMSEEVAKLFIEYRLKCERAAADLPEHEEIRKAELSHRYFKAMKLAGAYAFVDESPAITEDNAYQAIKLAEESGEAFHLLMNRDQPYVKLARYMAEVGRPVTHADLTNDLPYYKGSKQTKDELLQLGIAWGYQNNIIIKREFNDGIEFLRGESLKRTDLNQMVVSYSQDIATGYKNERAPWDKLHQMTQTSGIHWVNHHFKDGHRQEDSAVAGFNMIVVDVDGGVSLDIAKQLLTGYKALFYTTKRHTTQEHRFRILLPINYELALDGKDFKEFMRNIYEWLPFEVDEQTGQRARKWLAHNGHYEYTDGELLDVLPFIPKTSKNEQRKQVINSQQSLDNLERWFISNTGDGNRNNQLAKYALLLKDAGFDFAGVRSKVLELNNKLPDSLDEQEIDGTIMVTVGRALSQGKP